jgi:hypothetical protein
MNRKINGSKADAVKQKFCSCFGKNKGLKVMWEILCMLIRGGKKGLVDCEDLKDLSVSDTVCYKSARLVSCDVECTFTLYKSLFHDN